MDKEIGRWRATYNVGKSAEQDTLDGRGWHPLTFDTAKTTPEAIQHIQVRTVVDN